MNILDNKDKSILYILLETKEPTIVYPKETVIYRDPVIIFHESIEGCLKTTEVYNKDQKLYIHVAEKNLFDYKHIKHKNINNIFKEETDDIYILDAVKTSVIGRVTISDIKEVIEKENQKLYIYNYNDNMFSLTEDVNSLLESFNFEENDEISILKEMYELANLLD